MLIPIVGFIVWIIVALDLAKSYGRGTGFGIGLIIFPYVWSLILGFGSDTYKGPPRRLRSATRRPDPGAAPDGSPAQQPGFRHFGAARDCSRSARNAANASSSGSLASVWK